MSADIQEFHPVRMSRQGELVAWGVWGVVTFAWVWLARLGSVPAFIPLFWGVLTLMAGGTTLGNWMDARTVLRITPEEVFFYNGLRKVTLPWGDVQKIEVLPSRWGEVVHVWGGHGHFRLRTLSEVRAAGRPGVSTQMGFPRGDHIVRELSRRSGLQVRKEETSGRTYYARE
ncbi:MAG: hypothetical protein D6755_06995 [Anaerolineae bacterium]|nr:MAG: hypothetical protein D6755_06995 [Anaerolineae bacterium]